MDAVESFKRSTLAHADHLASVRGRYDWIARSLPARTLQRWQAVLPRSVNAPFSGRNLHS
jgi:hypothetical protein